MNTIRDLGKQVICVMIFANMLGSSMNIAAQTRPRGPVAANKAASRPKCSGAWTGSVTYTKTQTTTDNKRVERVSGRGFDTNNFEMDFEYRAQVGVYEAPGGNAQSVGSASIIHSMTSVEQVDSVEKNSCDRGKTWRDMKGSATTKTERIGNASKQEANVTVSVNDDGTYSVGVGVPSIKGKVSGSESITFSGQCTPKEGKNITMPPTETSIDGHSLTSPGTDRVTGDGNQLSGIYTSALPGGGSETITWNLQKCGAPLRITDLKFEDMKFPNWNDWKEIVEQTGTIDGNLVKVKTKILNASGEAKSGELLLKETFKGDKWEGARPDSSLDENSVSFVLDPGEEREIEVVWDTNGYSWYDDGRPRLVQRVKAELRDNGKLLDDETKNLKVAPKPVVLVHGLWSNWRLFEVWQNILTTSHSYDWKAFPVGEKPAEGLLDTGGTPTSPTEGKTVMANAKQLKSYIEYAQSDRNAWHVDVVAHSSGGQITRNYINDLMPPAYPDGRPLIAHLLTLGTPHLGSKCADGLYLISGNHAVYQLTQDFAAGFNRLNTDRKGVKFSVLAGDSLPVGCKAVEPNDGFVGAESAIWTIKDNARTKSLHTELTGTVDFSGFVKPRLAVGPKAARVPEMP